MTTTIHTLTACLTVLGTVAAAALGTLYATEGFGLHPALCVLGAFGLGGAFVLVLTLQAKEMS